MELGGVWIERAIGEVMGFLLMNVLYFYSRVINICKKDSFQILLLGSCCALYWMMVN